MESSGDAGSTIAASLFLAGDAPDRSGAGALVGDVKRHAKYDAPFGEPCPFCGVVVEMTDAYQIIDRRRWHQRCNDENIRRVVSASIASGAHTDKPVFLCEYCGEWSQRGHYSVSWQDRKYSCPDCAKRNGEDIPNYMLKSFVPFDPAAEIPI